MLTSVAREDVSFDECGHARPREGTSKNSQCAPNTEVARRCVVVRSMKDVYAEVIVVGNVDETVEENQAANGSHDRRERSLAEMALAEGTGRRES